MPSQDQTIAYVDCFSGISGDMFVSALLDAGMPEQHLSEALSKVDIEDYQIRCSKTSQNKIVSTRFEVSLAKKQPHRSWSTIKELIATSGLSEAVKEKSILIFEALAQAEAVIHDCSPDNVHFHEVGAVDSIVDIIGAAIGLEYFHIKQLYASPLPMPSGWVHCEHGTLPLPAPAVCELLKGMPVYGVDHKTELVTPTGAAILKAFCLEYGPMPSMTLGKTGYGSGQKKLKDNLPNLLRLVIGSAQNTSEHQEVIITETNLDDWSPESFPYLSEQLFSFGALDVTLIPIQMKKGRPGFTVQVISSPAHAQDLQSILLTETSAIGLRFRKEQRWTLPRKNGVVTTKWGDVAAKLVESPAGKRVTPEYEDCRRVALEQKIPLPEIYKEIISTHVNNFVAKTTDDTL